MLFFFSFYAFCRCHSKNGWWRNGRSLGRKEGTWRMKSRQRECPRDYRDDGISDLEDDLIRNEKWWDCDCNHWRAKRGKVKRGRGLTRKRCYAVLSCLFFRQFSQVMQNRIKVIDGKGKDVQERQAREKGKKRGQERKQEREKRALEGESAPHNMPWRTVSLP